MAALRVIKSNNGETFLGFTLAAGELS